MALAFLLEDLLLVPRLVKGFLAIDNKVCDGHVVRSNVSAIGSKVVRVSTGAGPSIANARP